VEYAFAVDVSPDLRIFAGPIVCSDNPAIVRGRHKGARTMSLPGVGAALVAASTALARYFLNPGDLK
jgi:hypothetical protein